MSRIVRSSFVAVLVVGLIAVASPALAVTVTGSITNIDPTSQGRPVAGGVTSSCASPQPYPGTNLPANAFHHDAHAFSNTSGTAQCVTVQTTVGSSEFAKVAAYAPSFDPANLSQNFLGHFNASFEGDTHTFSFVAPVGTFVVVVFEAVAGTGVSDYSIDVTGTGVLLGSGVTVTGSITNIDPTSQGRPVAGGVTSSCASPQPYPGTNLPANAFHHDAHAFSNTSGTAQCVTVQTTVGSSEFAKVAAYAPSFDPANLSQNFLGHFNASFEGDTHTFSFVAPVGTFVVVVFEAVANIGVSDYSIDVLGTGVANGVAACSLVGPVLTLAVPSGASATMGRSGSAFNVTGPGIADPTCGGATMNNVDSIAVTGDGGAQQVSMDLSGGPIGPGATSEQSGTSEIETSVDLGGGSDSFVLQGSAANDRITIGTGGVNLNTDGDADLTFAGVEGITVNGGAGNDRLEAKGGKGTGDAFAASLTVHGETGADKLVGGRAGDTIDGGANNDTFTSLAAADGADRFIGGAGSDTTSYAPRTGAVQVLLDNVANDGGSGGAEGDDIRDDVEKVTGGKGGDTVDAVSQNAKNTFKGMNGNDTLRGGLGNDTLVGGDGADVLEGAAGKDALNTQDGVGVNDTANGGPDNDTCKTDIGDTRIACEA